MLYVDSSNVEEIRDLWKWGCFSGVTTNPIIWAKDGGGRIEDRLRAILAVSSGSVSVQLTSPLATEEDVGALLDEAEGYSYLSPRVVIKTPTGGPVEQYAIAELVRNKIPVNVTCCMTAAQAIMAAYAGASYVSLFWNRIRDAEGWPEHEVEYVRKVLNTPPMIDCDIIVGSIRKPSDVVEALRWGADIVTVPPKILRAMLAHPKTTETVAEMRAACK